MQNPCLKRMEARGGAVPWHVWVQGPSLPLGCMEHRGGCSADNDSGDGSGLMTTVPWDLLDSWQAENGRGPLDRSTTGWGGGVPPTADAEVVAAKKRVSRNSDPSTPEPYPGPSGG